MKCMNIQEITKDDTKPQSYLVLVKIQQDSEAAAKMTGRVRPPWQPTHESKYQSILATSAQENSTCTAVLPPERTEPLK